MFRVTYRTDIPMNPALLYLAHATAYKLMYVLEEEHETANILGMFNRQKTDGTYSIWVTGLKT